MSEAVDNAIQIDQKNAEIDAGLKVIKPCGDEWAMADAEYDKQLAITLMKLNNGVEMELDGVKICKPPATVAKKIAEGIVYEAKFKKNLSWTEYNRVRSKLDSISKQLSAIQSKNRHLSVS